MASGRHTPAEKTEYRKNRSGGSRVIVLFLAFALVFGVAVGGTVAWLMAESETVVNTFTYGDIDITLEESDTEEDDDDDPTTNTYEMMPGEIITKDPVVTVLKDNEACWLFVQLVESENFDDYMTYGIASGWTQLKDAEGEDIPGVYYREVNEDRDSQDERFSVLADNQVKVLDSVTKEMLNDLDEGDAALYPTLTITAYAVQRNSDIDAIDTALDAWLLAMADSETP